MQPLKDLFHFSKKQRNGLFTLLACVAVLQVTLYVDELFYTAPKLDEKTKEAFYKLVAEDSLARFKASVFPAPFAFNPNTANDSILKALGLPLHLRQSMLKYTGKGGEFRQKSDLYKLYGIDSAWVRHVYAYATLPEEYHKKDKKYQNQKPTYKRFNPNSINLQEAEAVGLREWQVKRLISYREKVKPFYEKTDLYKVYGFDSSLVKDLYPYIYIDTSTIKLPKAEATKAVLVDIAVADSAALTQIKGIGGWSAKRIVAYRDKLGGFWNKDQLLEVYGMTPERYEQVKDQVVINKLSLRKLNINSAEFKTLLAHPYLDYEMVKSLVNFRENTRKFKNVSELINLEGFNEVKLQRLKPYLEL